MNGYTRGRTAPYTQAPGYRAPAAPPAAPAPPAGAYPGAVPRYGDPPSYGPVKNYGAPPAYQFQPDHRLSQQARYAAHLSRQRMAQELAAAAAEKAQAESQYQGPRQSRMTFLGGY